MRRGGHTINVTETSTQERYPLVRERVPRRLRVIRVSGLGKTIQEEPTSRLEPLTCSSRVIIQVLRRIARSCVSPIPRPGYFSPLCPVLHRISLQVVSEWYQESLRPLHSRLLRDVVRLAHLLCLPSGCGQCMFVRPSAPLRAAAAAWPEVCSKIAPSGA